MISSFMLYLPETRCQESIRLHWGNVIAYFIDSKI